MARFPTYDGDDREWVWVLTILQAQPESECGICRDQRKDEGPPDDHRDHGDINYLFRTFEDALAMIGSDLDTNHAKPWRWTLVDQDRRTWYGEPPGDDDPIPVKLECHPLY